MVPNPAVAAHVIVGDRSSAGDETVTDEMVGGAIGDNARSALYADHPLTSCVATAHVYAPPDVNAAALTVADWEAVEIDCSVVWSAPAPSTQRIVAPFVSRTRRPVWGNEDWWTHENVCASDWSTVAPAAGDDTVIVGRADAGTTAMSDHSDGSGSAPHVRTRH